VIEGDINPWIRELSRFNVLNLDVESFTLEDIFMRYYQDQETE
jgi:hypothetical protein